MAHSLTWQSNGLFRNFTDEISPEEILKSNFDIHIHPQFEKIKYIINDFTKVTELVINSGHTKIYASTDDVISDTKGKLKIAIVANQDAHIALANSYREQMKNKFFECEIFQTQEEAQVWAEL